MSALAPRRRPAPDRLRVREAEAADAEAVCRMAAELSRHEGQPAPALDPERFRRDGLGRHFSALLAELDAAAVGYALYHGGYEVGSASPGLYLADLWVEPAARRRGIGHALMAALARRCRAGGGRWIQWSVYVGNEPAIGFYNALGANRPAAATFDLGPAALDRLILRGPRADTEPR